MRIMAIGFNISILLEKPNDLFEFKPVCYNLDKQKESLYKILKINGLDKPINLHFNGMGDIHVEASILI